MNDEHEAAAEGVTSTKSPQEHTIYRGKSVEVPSKLALRRQKTHVDDNHSVGTISTSYSKAHSATFSAPQFDFHMHSPSATTPTTSRPQSPTRLTSAPGQAMELGLVGIGEHVNTLPSGKFIADLPILSRDPRLPEPQLPRDGGSTPTGIYSAAESLISSRDSDSDSDICRSDLDLESAANIALSRSLGVRLSRLSHPVRVIEAFSKFKDQCVEILQQEEAFSTIDWDDDGFSCYDVEEGDASNGNSALDETSNRAQQSDSGTKKRPAAEQGGDDGHDEMGENDGQDQGPTRRGRSKRRKIGRTGGFSCPFRKRNPWRFNAREFDACANKPYKDMAELKRHISADHGNQSCTYCGQPRTAEDHPPKVCLRNQQLNPSCDPRDPEDGVDNLKDASLRSRAAGCKIQTWAQLWNLLFPNDEEIPSQAFDPVIEHHEIAAEGCEKFVLKTAEDIFDSVPQSSGLSLQAIQEILHKGTKVLLRGSKYADYGRCKMVGNNDMIQMSTPMKGKSVVQVIHSQVDDVFDDGESPGVIVTLQSSPQGAPVIYNSTSTGLKSSPVSRERLIAPKIERAPTPSVTQKTCLATGALIQDGSPISTGGHQNPNVPDLADGDTFYWPDADFQNWNGGYGDENMYMEGANTEDFWPSYEVPGPR
ncbi:hypothetical protein HER10_EVM0000208 [Colletotrichum scovillei]|uniref:Zinc finger domain-containing protein n=1 Tax=Colletotrichum scovillei TaxID=1209932 RepID=A0A9P7RIJ5_9PEZI|nr:uncharacterized protein HER10_EVM0000208 [Colletotrichum scovillei]KAF4777342.1 hypothetical protein HER10_EVM0000208 [Colletotrichum scovillei]KAG7059011.1 zinc finger domain-containing protein [Colletotrichum scovillei]KAG7077654.1 zinc finger domain-containing protein [Colletotrichum scovillei]KAG7084784.1 zinc finger domain-containing protein [Colletotrichum scovillei]